MDTGTVGLIISGIVGLVQILNFFRTRSLHKESTINDELSIIKEDINELKVQNAICDNKHYNTSESIKEQMRALEKIVDKLEGKC